MSGFGELLEKLARAEVRYVLVGGGAVLLHGHVRVTNDLDILIEASDENARRLLEALATWGDGAGTELTVAELSVAEPGALRVHEDFSLDVFTLMRARALGRSFTYADLAVDARRQTLSNGVKVVYASIPRLLDLKAGTGRAKDELDMIVLSEIARGARASQPVDFAAMQPDPAAESDEQVQDGWPLESNPDH